MPRAWYARHVTECGRLAQERLDLVHSTDVERVLLAEDGVYGNGEGRQGARHHVRECNLAVPHAVAHQVRFVDRDCEVVDTSGLVQHQGLQVSSMGSIALVWVF